MGRPIHSQSCREAGGKKKKNKKKTKKKEKGKGLGKKKKKKKMQMPGQGQGREAVVGAAAVMTEEQIETLRRQISVYATICQQLVQMHKAMVSHQSSISGFRPGQGPTGDPNNNMHVTGSRLSSRQRWTPSQTQLQLLEKFFEQENGAPSKQRIKEITAELSQHGQISETNVYNWFQNRRARSKRKNVGGGERGGAANALESEVETDGEVPAEKKPKAEEHLGFVHKSEHIWSDEQRGMMHSVKNHGTSFNIPSDPALNRNAQLEEHLYVPECESLY